VTARLVSPEEHAVDTDDACPFTVLVTFHDENEQETPFKVPEHDCADAVHDTNDELNTGNDDNGTEKFTDIGGEAIMNVEAAV
jgi:hypothetical protein